MQAFRYGTGTYSEWIWVWGEKTGGRCNNGLPPDDEFYYEFDCRAPAMNRVEYGRKVYSSIPFKVNYKSYNRVRGNTGIAIGANSILHHSHFVATGDFVKDGTSAVYTHSSGSGRITHPAASFVEGPEDWPGLAGWGNYFILEYSIGAVVNPDNLSIRILTYPEGGFNDLTWRSGDCAGTQEIPPFPGAGVHWVFGKAPVQDFVIEVTSTAACSVEIYLTMRLAPQTTVWVIAGSPLAFNDLVSDTVAKIVCYPANDEALINFQPVAGEDCFYPEVRTPYSAAITPSRSGVEVGTVYEVLEVGAGNMGVQARAFRQFYIKQLYMDWDPEPAP